MGKKKPAVAAKASSTTATTSKAIGSSDSSSLLRSAFAPTSFQLHLFASVIQSFESQQLRIHDTTNGRLRQQYAVSTREEITCLAWGRYGGRDSKTPNKKKRKRAQDPAEDAVVAYGTNHAEICMFSPTQGQVISTLKNGHEGKVLDFQFDLTQSEAWSLGDDHKLVQWNLKDDTIIRTVNLTDTTASILSLPSQSAPQIFYASTAPQAIHFESKDVFRIDKFDAFKNPVQVLLRPEAGAKDEQDLLIAADSERYINLYDVKDSRIARILIASDNIVSASLSRPFDEEDQILLVLTREGLVEIFSKPFALPPAVNGDSKSQAKSRTRKADASIKLMKDKETVPISTAYIDGPNVIVCSLSGGIEPTFQKVRWEDEGNGQLLFSGVKQVQRIQPQSSTNSATMNGAKDMGKTHVNESKTVVGNGTFEPGSQSAPVEIESSDDEAEDDDDEAEPDNEDVAADDSEGSDAEMVDAEDNIETAEIEEEGEPSFGEQLAAKHPEVISITDALSGSDKALSKSLLAQQMMLPSGMSLGTVLTQSLRTNDQSLLETCLHVTDENIIRNTLLRLDSSLAANLLTKLAERLADRPGRYGHLLIWVQSTMIAHGGAIASQAGVAAKLRTLYQVLNERSRILPQLHLLKGKLDMMTAQQAFRQEHAAAKQHIDVAPGAIYIEGKDDNWSSDEDIAVAKKSKTKAKDLDALIARSESSDDEGMPLVNGDFHTDESGSEEDSEADAEQNGVVDNEAELSQQSDESSVSSDESEEDDEEDSELEDFINDGEISVEEEDEVLDDVQKPAKKKSKHR